MSSSQSAIAKTYTVQTNSHNAASKAKKPSHGSHSVSVNCNETSTNYGDTFAYFRITNNTFGARLNPPESLCSTRRREEAKFTATHVVVTSFLLNIHKRLPNQQRQRCSSYFIGPEEKKRSALSGPRPNPFR